MNIDERLQFLVQSTESLHATAQQVTDQIAELTRRAGANERRADANEREIQRFRRAMRAALKAWLEEEEGENGQQK